MGAGQTTRHSSREELDGIREDTERTHLSSSRELISSIDLEVGSQLIGDHVLSTRRPGSFLDMIHNLRRVRVILLSCLMGLPCLDSSNGCGRSKMVFKTISFILLHDVVRIIQKLGGGAGSDLKIHLL